jgi:hypothetical protein
MNKPTCEQRIEHIKKWFEEKELHNFECYCKWRGHYLELTDCESDEEELAEFGPHCRWCPACGNCLDDPLEEYRGLIDILDLWVYLGLTGEARHIGEDQNE